jgi:predicted RNA-binding protein with PUA-like domain
MNRWLIKSDPHDYSAHDLARDGQTTWDGVRNAVALKNLRAMQPGDAVLVYHTGGEKAVVATASVAAAPRPDAKDAKLAVVELRFEDWLVSPATLRAVKADAFFADFALVRQARLSVMPVTDEQWKRLLKMGGGLAETGR